MRVPLRWLSEYVNLTLNPQELAERLTIAGLEVGEIISSVGDWKGIIVGQVVEVARHPNADRLVLVTVELRLGERQTVVCGAPNVDAGQKIAFAPAGTRLLDSHTGESIVLKSAVIRGVESVGMVCSEKELGLSDEHEGILVLADDAVVGRPLESHLGEVVFDLDPTPNRPDLFSIVGVAREVAALTGQSLREPSIEHKVAGPLVTGRLKVDIADRDLCPRYCAALIEGVSVAESPSWLQERLISAGQRPINNIVDISNYVMLELGQPLHAFDLDKIRGKKIIVRPAELGEKMPLLDGTEHELSPEMLVIADAELPLALAGIMGGLASEVDQGTTTILLESANFQGASIRRTSKALKVRTEASTRFEKGLSRQLPPVALERAVKLISELCGGRAAKGLFDVFPGNQADIRVTLTQERLHRVLGVEVPKAQVRQILTSLGFVCRWVPPDRFVVRVPYWRTDVTIADDVIEEIARIIGYDSLPTSLLRGELPTLWPQPKYRLRERVSDAIVAAGFQEIIGYSLTSMETLAQVLAPEELVLNRPLRITNPMSREAEYGRTTLRASLLGTLAANAKAGVGLLSLFEAGRVYLPRIDDLPQEVEGVCAVLSGRRLDRWGRPTGEPVGFYDAKTYLEQLLDVLGVPVTVQEAEDFAYLPGRTAAVLVDGQQVGLMGQVHPRVTASFDIEAEVAMFELNLDALQPHILETVHFRPVSQYPPVVEDLAITVSQAIAAGQAIGIIKSFPLVRAVSVFDVYTGPPVPKGKKSLAFSLTFQTADHTLTDAEVGHQRQRIVERLRRELGAELRS